MILLQVFEGAASVSPYNALGYGLLVVFMGYWIFEFWKTNKKLTEDNLKKVEEMGLEHKKEIEVLRAENRKDVELMLETNSKSIPILTNVISTLDRHEKGSNELSIKLQSLVDNMKKVHEDHFLIKNGLKINL